MEKFDRRNRQRTVRSVGIMSYTQVSASGASHEYSCSFQIDLVFIQFTIFVRASSNRSATHAQPWKIHGRQTDGKSVFPHRPPPQCKIRTTAQISILQIMGLCNGNSLIWIQDLLRLKSRRCRLERHWLDQAAAVSLRPCFTRRTRFTENTSTKYAFVAVPLTTYMFRGTSRRDVVRHAPRQSRTATAWLTGWGCATLSCRFQGLVPGCFPASPKVLIRGLVRRRQMPVQGSFLESPNAHIGGLAHQAGLTTTPSGWTWKRQRARNPKDSGPAAMSAQRLTSGATNQPGPERQRTDKFGVTFSAFA